MRRIPVPDSANPTITVSLGGKTYNFTYSFNSISGRYYLDISYQGNLIIPSLKLLPNTYLLKKYALSDFSHGDLILINIGSTTEEAGRDNIGIGKPYELFYVSNEEFDV